MATAYSLVSSNYTMYYLNIQGTWYSLSTLPTMAMLSELYYMTNPPYRAALGIYLREPSTVCLNIDLSETELNNAVFDSLQLTY